jgi:hypothetical protein
MATASFAGPLRILAGLVDTLTTRHVLRVADVAYDFGLGKSVTIVVHQ